MKRKLLLFIAVISVNIFSAGSQTVFPAYTDNPLWRSMQCLYGIGIYCWTDSLQYDYDTTFCGYTYSRMSALAEPAYCRTDSMKTFIRTTTDCLDKEYLMYDYSMNIGDTVHVGYNLFVSPDTAKFTLQSIDTAIYFGIARRRFHMLLNHNMPYSTYLYIPMIWIEGVGSDWNPFYPLYCLHDGCETTYSLRCYDSSGVQLYIDPSISICDSATGITEYDSYGSITVFPNPATEQFTVYGLRGTIEKTEVYSILGEKLFSQQLTANNQQQINVSRWKNGIYFVKIKTPEGEQAHKLIINH